VVLYGLLVIYLECLIKMKRWTDTSTRISAISIELIDKNELD